MLGCHHTLVLIGYQKQSCVSVEKHTEKQTIKIIYVGFLITYL